MPFETYEIALLFKYSDKFLRRPVVEVKSLAGGFENKRRLVFGFGK